MKIVADENIPLLNEFFADICQSNLVTLPGRDMTQADLADADILLVRSITQVNESLLKGTNVKFVGTCTIGTDHLDEDYLSKNNIHFQNAPGCNAQAVVEYVVSSLLVLAERRQVPWQQLSVGIVGAGNVGGRLLKTLKALNIKVCAYDPNIEGLNSKEQSESVWLQDVVTLHTPIIHEGEFKTHHLVDAKRLSEMQPSACIINSCRGSVIDNNALLNHLNSHPRFLAILDVWEQEPAPNDELMRACLLATPHIAGYSLDGKLTGTAMIYDALCQFLRLPARIKLADLAPQAPIEYVEMTEQADMEYTLRKLVRSGYDVRDDHFRMLSLLGLNHKDKARGFDTLRKKYPMRRELNSMALVSHSPVKPSSLQALGIKIKGA
jgi:erythronate-4-phosphate dehydrogenase